MWQVFYQINKSNSALCFTSSSLEAPSSNLKQSRVWSEIFLSCIHSSQSQVFFFIIFILNFNILSSKVLVHWIEPNVRFEHCTVSSMNVQRTIQAWSKESCSRCCPFFSCHIFFMPHHYNLCQNKSSLTFWKNFFNKLLVLPEAKLKTAYTKLVYVPRSL